jgi:K+-transporting ATPase ATPase C chain
MASASGLDPDIGPENAFLQVHRVSLSRGMDETRLKSIVEKSIENRFLGLLGEPCVNVLKLNLAMDAALN